MTDYKNEFENAVQRSKRLGLLTPEITFTEDRFITGYKMGRLFEDARKEFRGYNPKDFARKCIQIHKIIQPLVNKIFFGTSYYTIGYIHESPKDIYKITEEKIEEYLKEGLSSNSIELHTWITLPSMEIIDFSICSTLDEMHNKANIGVDVLAKHPSKFSDGLRYCPVLVGTNFLDRLGIL